MICTCILSFRPDSSLLSSFFSYNYWLLAGESSPHSHSNQRSLSPSEAKLRNSTVKWIQVANYLYYHIKTTLQVHSLLLLYLSDLYR